MGTRETYHLSNSNCATFDGFDDYITVGNPSELQLTTGATLTGWVNTASANMRTISKDDGSTNRCYLVQITSAGKVEFGIFKSGSFFSIESNTSVNDGSDHHYACVNDGTDLKVYIDGVLDNTASGSGGTIDNDAADFEIGRVGTPTEYFNGTQFDLRVYNTGLSASDIDQIYKNTFTDTANLAGYWPLSEGAGVVAYDASGNGNHGTIKNATLPTFWGSTQNDFHYNLTAGHSKLMYFDGSCNVDLDHGGGIGSSFIISTWFVNCTDMSATQFLLNFRPVDSDANEIRFYVKNANLAAVIVDKSGSGNNTYKTYYGTTTLQKNILYKAALVFDGTNLDLYLQEGDGILIKEPSYTKAMDGTVTTSDTIRIRKIGSGTNNLNAWKGIIKELQIAKYSEENLAEIIAGNFSFADFSYTGADWEDQTGNGNDGTVVGSSSNIRIPALADASADAVGGPLLNPAWDGENNNDAETTIDKETIDKESELTGTVDWETQDYLHYNLINGFRQEGCKIPAIPWKQKAVNGLQLTNLPWDGFKLNGAESVWRAAGA
ncbi:MAG: hypothetical protein OMM_00562 [Candidatus Magnetoglobus multicellularis str. Araruama]|uniref:LamG-like jellyroll fold domain-containing protein n=1 Tax=Candidatus Magnetoglobus multicellularis str. Araruama TaxID=890399 RepID=A0A1V1PGW9_9BACT|nr:MAG: hypothetical protein OMM_00562 [Candidatus Magnetoglobus multicellularis str. Araruama]